MTDSNAYFRGMCKNCLTDCDDEFCSEDCREEWESGYEDHLYEIERDRRLMEDNDD